MNDLIIMKNQQAVTTSLNIANDFDKEHHNVIKAAESLKKDVVNFNEMFFEGSEPDSYGRPRKVYYMNRDGFTLLVMGFTGSKSLEFKLKYINAFNEMEKSLKTPMTIEDIMIATIETQKQLKAEVNVIKDDVTMLKDEYPIAPYPLLLMENARKSKVIDVLGGKESNAYGKMSNRVFAEAGRDFKKFFGIPRYDMLPKKHEQDGLDYWSGWEPCTNTKMEIRELNSQISLEV